ncbi:hypothetical protein BELL_0250g00160 [Botrytis elliptica]|uniref:Uncharacterized protein n=1 Tax=Botrytis elliptica TaxID=278938 RepID=A0A4Z1K0M4_9HELO|nr:hypothetical protein BELL_0250g00160 [Botrytis elliptica]
MTINESARNLIAPSPVGYVVDPPVHRSHDIRKIESSEIGKHWHEFERVHKDEPYLSNLLLQFLI